MSADKKMSKNKIISIVTTSVVILLMAAIACYSFFGRSDNTRTHFSAVSTQKLYTDMMSESEEQNEFEQFEFDLVDIGQLQFDDNFKTNYPSVTAALTDLDFCGSETAVKSVDFGDGIMVMDAYSYVSDYSTRWIDVLYIPYGTDSNRNIVISAPIRYMIKYDSTLAKVSLETLDIENYRLNFYTLALSAQAGDTRSEWNGTATLETNSVNEGTLKDMNSNLSVTDSASKSLSLKKSVAENKAVSSFRLEENQAGAFILKLNFDDTMFTQFKTLTVSLANDDNYASDSTSFILTVNG